MPSSHESHVGLLMNPAPGNVYATDISFMNFNDPFHTSSLASTSTTPLYPVTTLIHDLPGHLLPGTTYYRPHQAEAFRIYDETCATEHTYQPFHPGWTTMTERTQDVHADEVIGQGFPLMTPIFDLDSVGEMTPLSDVQDLQPLSSNAFEPLMSSAAPEGSPGLCDAVIQAFAAERMPWDVLSPFGPGFDRQSISQSVYEDPSDAMPVCQWCDNGSPCNMPYSPGKNQKHSISQHFNKVHHLSVGGKLPQRCLWLGCTKELKQESIVRHILTVHLRVKSACEGCGTSFARPDSLQRHMKKSCGAGKEEP